MIGFETYMSIPVSDIYYYILHYIGNQLTLKPNTYVIGGSQTVFQKFIQSDTYVAKLPILTLVPGDLQPDEVKMTWHMNVNKNIISKYRIPLYELEDDNMRLEIGCVPYLYHGHFDIVYIAPSYPDALSFRIFCEEIFHTRAYGEYKIPTVLLFPNQVIASNLNYEQFEIFDEMMPKLHLKLTDEIVYAIPFTLRVFLRLTGQSDSSSLFPNQSLPDYVSTLNFEFTTNLPTRLTFRLNQEFTVINLNITYGPSPKSEVTENIDLSQKDVLIIKNLVKEPDLNDSFTLSTIFQAVDPSEES
jgi:hypothetical protein